VALAALVARLVDVCALRYAGFFFFVDIIIPGWPSNDSVDFRACCRYYTVGSEDLISLLAFFLNKRKFSRSTALADVT
jgi:hypothetical protein